MKVTRYKSTRFWSVAHPDDRLVCVCVYRRGARNVVRLIRQLEQRLADAAHVPPPPARSRTHALLRRRA